MTQRASTRSPPGGPRRGRGRRGTRTRSGRRPRNRSGAPRRPPRRSGRARRPARSAGPTVVRSWLADRCESSGHRMTEDPPAVLDRAQAVGGAEPVTRARARRAGAASPGTAGAWRRCRWGRCRGPRATPADRRARAAWPRSHRRTGRRPRLRRTLVPHCHGLPFRCRPPFRCRTLSNHDDVAAWKGAWKRRRSYERSRAPTRRHHLSDAPISR